MRCRGLSKKPYICYFQTNYPYYHGFYASFWAFRPIWLAISIFGSSFWLEDTYFWSFFSWLAKSGCQNLKLAGNTFPPFPSFWSPGSDLGEGRVELLVPDIKAGSCFGSSTSTRGYCTISSSRVMRGTRIFGKAMWLDWQKPHPLSFIHIFSSLNLVLHWNGSHLFHNAMVSISSVSLLLDYWAKWWCIV